VGGTLVGGIRVGVLVGGGPLGGSWVSELDDAMGGGAFWGGVGSLILKIAPLSPERNPRPADLKPPFAFPASFEICFPIPAPQDLVLR